MDTPDTELQQLVPDSNSGRLYADKLVEVTFLNGDLEWLLIHIEVQGAVQKDFNERMFLYHFRIREKYRMPVISLAVLTDLKGSFRPGLYQNCLLGQEHTFRFPLVKLGSVDVSCTAAPEPVYAWGKARAARFGHSK